MMREEFLMMGHEETVIAAEAPTVTDEPDSSTRSPISSKYSDESELMTEN